jgi:hypothetical protein
VEVRVCPRSRLVQQTLDKNAVHLSLGFRFTHRGNLGRKIIQEFNLLVEVFQEEPLRYRVQLRLPESGNDFWFPY